MKLLCKPTLLASLLWLSGHVYALSPVEVEEPALRAHLRLLSSDLFEGRGTGQRGGDLTVAYLETQAQAIGLQALNHGSYRQAVPILGVKNLPEQSDLHLSTNGNNLGLHFADDWVWNTANGKTSQQFDHELIFVGYGTQAPEENWDDFKGVDVRGKILLVLANDPQPTASEPQRFAGKAMTYYGRRSYKVEQALRLGAAGVLVIHTEASALSNWSVVSHAGVNEQFQLANQVALNNGIAVQGWIQEAAAKRLFLANGLDLDLLRQAAETREFKPQALQTRLRGKLQTSVRQLEQYNIAGLVPGTDPQLKNEVVIYSAHWDHLGKQEGSGDTIYNGAVDNGSGTAALLAMAKAAVQQPAKRSQLFLWVAAEEQGLLGSAYYAAQPLIPLAKTAANLNLDTLNFVGRTKDISTFGSERSELAEIASKVAQQMNLNIAPPRLDVAGVYFRSDHFSFAKAGVPAFSVGSGSDYLENPQASAEKRRAYGQRYHQVSDEYDASWDLRGMREQAQFTLNLGRAIADWPHLPQWKAGDPFAKNRLRP